MLVAEDILNVAESLNLGEISPEEIKWVLDNYETYQEDDPGATWDLVVEQQLDEMISSRGTFYYLT